jgi:hypothetical protein
MGAQSRRSQRGMVAAQRRGMIIRKLALILGIVCGVTACGATDGSHEPDLQAGADMRSLASDMRSLANQGKACVTDDDCDSPDYKCSYPIADGCSAKGQCRAVPEPSCTVIALSCGCDGKAVPSGICFYDSGYAGGPIVPGVYPDGCPGHGVGDGGM